MTAALRPLCVSGLIFEARMRTELAAGLSMRRLVLALTLAVATAAPAYAVSLSDLIDLSRAGLSDDILMALVDTDRSVFHLEPRDLKELKAQGLSDRLILHLLMTRERRDEAAREEAGQEQIAQRLDQAVAVPSAPPAHPRDREVVVIERVAPVAVPVYVPIYVEPVEPPKPAKTVYWGWGGKRRPDSWKPAPAGRERK
jgi:hypothetical protein